MNPISIFCPVTNEPVDTGIQTNWSTFSGFEGAAARSLPALRRRHEMAVREGYLRAFGSRPRLVAAGRRKIRKLESLLAKLAQG